mgnify:CR=1 FL=1
MPFRRVPLLALAVLSFVLVVASCGRGGFGREYEYDEEIFLDLDGSATVVVNGSLYAFVALHGLAVNPDPGVRFDRAAFRALWEADGVEVTRVSRPWRRDGRRFVQVRLEVDDIRRLGRVAPLAWSAIAYEAEGDQMVYRQRIGESRNAPVTGANWTGEELVAFRLHLPSRITFHNAPSREVERGNIVRYEQPLTERLKGVPVEVEVRMDRQSIFRRTMTVFGISVGAALSLLALIILWVRRKGQASQPAA